MSIYDLFLVQFAVVHQDGTPLHYQRRQVTINLSVESMAGSRSEEVKLITSDNGIVHYTFHPEDKDQFITIIVRK